MTCVIAGIDFGTSNSAVSISVDFAPPVLIPFEFNGAKYNTIPSVVSYGDDGRTVEYGRAAIDAYQQGTSIRFIRSIKRIVSYNLQLDESTRIGLRTVRFIDIVKNFLRYLKEHAEREIQRQIDYVVIGRPVVFVDDNPKKDMETEQAIRRIANEIGFKHIEFQYEPIAATFAHEQNITRETLALTIDIGAGTSDFSIIRLSPKSERGTNRRDDILATTGINIAGNDFDYEFSMHTFMKYFGYQTQYRIGNGMLALPNGIYSRLSDWTGGTTDELIRDYNKNASAWHNAENPDCIARLKDVILNREKFELLSTVEQTKIYLTDKPEKTVKLSYGDNDCFVNVSRDDLEYGLQNKLNKIQEKIEECIEKSGKNKSDIQMLIFTGGSSQIPVIQLNITKMFPHIRPENIVKSDVFSSVSMGLAYYGINLWRK